MYRVIVPVPSIYPSSPNRIAPAGDMLRARARHSRSNYSRGATYPITRTPQGDLTFEFPGDRQVEQFFRFRIETQGGPTWLRFPTPFPYASWLPPAPGRRIDLHYRTLAVRAILPMQTLPPIAPGLPFASVSGGAGSYLAYTAPLTPFLPLGRQLIPAASVSFLGNVILTRRRFSATILSINPVVTPAAAQTGTPMPAGTLSVRLDFRVLRSFPFLLTKRRFIVALSLTATPGRSLGRDRYLSLAVTGLRFFHQNGSPIPRQDSGVLGQLKALLTDLFAQEMPSIELEIGAGLTTALDGVLGFGAGNDLPQEPVGWTITELRSIVLQDPAAGTVSGYLATLTGLAYSHFLEV